MGMEVALMAVAGGSEAGKMMSQWDAANSQQEALDLQGKQQELAYQEKSIANLDTIQKVIDAQTAAMTVSGTAFNSPSFNAIQRNTLNIGARSQRNIDIEKSIMDKNIDVEKANVRSKLYASLFGDLNEIASMGMKGFG